MIIKIIKIVSLFICTTIISFIIIRYLDGYRSGDEFLFPEAEIESIHIFAVVDKERNINHVRNFTYEEDIEFFEESLKTKKYVNRFFIKPVEYPFYQMTISFKLESVDDVILSLYSNGVIKVIANSEKSDGIVFYESELTVEESEYINSILNIYK